MIPVDKSGAGRGWRLLAVDGAIALVMMALALLNLFIGWQVYQPVSLPLALALTILAVLPLAFRRRWPLGVLGFITVFILALSLLDIPEETFTLYSVMLALLSVGAFGNPRYRTPVRVGCVSAIAVVLIFVMFVRDQTGTFSQAAVLSLSLAILYNLLLYGVAWWFGDIFRQSREREQDLKIRTVELEHEREENAQRAVLEERVRIARELHDVVAHHVSVIGVQAGAARRVIDKQPEKAKEALNLIETSSRQAVNEMYHLLGLLRQDSQMSYLMPQPGLAQLPVLVKEMQEAGLTVDVRVDGNAKSLPAGTDLSAFRIIQEALTNTLKHAGATRSTVQITYTDSVMELQVTDDGAGGAEKTEGKGRGLIGMRERVNLHGGELEAHPLPGRGFIVRAKLPLGRGKL
jgi:signal transduction histidine kinase